MKKLVLFLSIIVPTYTFAQINKGGIYIGGSLSTSLYSANDWSYQSYTSAQTLNNSFSISPNIGFMVSDKAAVGFSLGYSTSRLEYKNHTFDPNTGTIIPVTITNTSNSYLGGFFVRNFFALSDKFYFSLHNQVSFSRGTIKTEESPFGYSNTETPSYNLKIGTRPVFIFFPSAKWGIEAGLGYLGYTYNRILPDVAHSSTFDFNVGSFSFGLAYYPTKK
jgi:hypothetical protein